MRQNAETLPVANTILRNFALATIGFVCIGGQDVPTALKPTGGVCAPRGVMRTVVTVVKVPTVTKPVTPRRLRRPCVLDDPFALGGNEWRADPENVDPLWLSRAMRESSWTPHDY